MRHHLAILVALGCSLAATPAYAAGHGGGGGGGGGGSTAATYDVSYPQCSTALPSPIDGAIVGVNDGLVLSANPCLDREWAWATATATTYGAAFYANTGDPGPAVSHYWPVGQGSPQSCDSGDPDSTACSYDYGWNAARDSFGDAATVAGTTAAQTHRWWLDVETGNSWETLESQYGQTPSAQANDRAALAGEVAGLQFDGVTSTIGFYSTSSQWTQITGGTGTEFAANPAWVAGTGSLKTAQRNCTTASFTGAAIELAQYAKSGYDADAHCG